jgi:hypothetical protein
LAYFLWISVLSIELIRMPEIKSKHKNADWLHHEGRQHKRYRQRCSAIVAELDEKIKHYRSHYQFGQSVSSILTVRSEWSDLFLKVSITDTLGPAQPCTTTPVLDEAVSWEMWCIRLDFCHTFCVTSHLWKRSSVHRWISAWRTQIVT